MRQFKPGQLQTGSLYPISASYALTASYLSGSISINTGSLVTTASFNAFTASYTTGSFTGSFTGNLTGTASYSNTASYVNPLNQNVIITGSIYIPDNAHSIYFSGSSAASRLVWNDVDGTLDLGLKGGNVTLQIGQEQVVRVVNKTGADLLEADFRVVRVRSVSEGGAQGQRLAVVLAQADNDADSSTTLGVVTETILNNQTGFITILGQIHNIDTTGAKSYGGLETWVDGDMLYLSPTHAGYLTNIKPIAPQHLVIVGYVEYAHQNNGKIFVKVDNGYEIDELHNVRITTASLAAGQLLVRSGSNNAGVWINTNQLTGSYGLTGSLTATSFSGSLFGTASWANNAITASFITTAQTASYVLNAVSASVAQSSSIASTATTASHALEANTILPLGGNKLSGFISYVISTGSMQYVRAHHTLNIDIPIGGATSTVNLTGSLIASSITSSLQGSASFANTSTSASYAVTASYLDNYVPTFPYTGSAIITGSLIVIDENQYETINTVTHTFKDTSDIESIEWDKRRLNDAAGAVAVDWGSNIMSDSSTAAASIDWNQRFLYDTNGNERLAWSYTDRAAAIEQFAYTRNLIDLPSIGETLANQPVYNKYMPTGEVIQGVTFDAAVVNFDLVYLDTDNTWYPVDASTSSSTRMLGIAYNITAGDYVLLEGTTVVNDNALTDSPQVTSIQTGTPIYINTATAGIFMSTTVPSNAGDHIRLLGYAYYQSTGDSQYWLMKFKPSNDWYVI